MKNPLALRALRKASRILGGDERLRAMIDARPGAFLRWMQDAEELPEDVFGMLLDFLSDMETAPNSFILSSGRANERRGNRQ